MNQEKIGKLIKDIRIKNNLTQKEFADKYGVTYQAVSKWENGKNIPDISLMKQISKDFNIDINDILDGEITNKKRKNYLLPIYIIIIILLITIIILVCLNNNSTFNFRTLKSDCGDFDISGSLAYNKNKSSIYISSVNYCGNKDEKYKKIECSLYENNGNTDIKIDECDSKSGNIGLKDFLKNISFNIDNYISACKEYKKNSLYLEINATDFEDKTISYKIPLSISKNCK